MIRTKLWLAAVIAECSFTVVSLAQEPGAQHREREKPGEGSAAALLDITTHTDDEIAGEFRSESLHIIFRSRLEGPSHVVLHLRLGDDILEAEVDLEQRTAMLDGHGRALSRDELTALEDFGAEYERYLDPDRRPPLLHEDMLYRVLSFWSWTPADRPLKRHLVSAPVVTYLQPMAGHIR